MQLFCLRHAWRNIQGYGMRTAIRDIAEGAEMGLETGSVSGLSCGLYGSVDFGEDYREVTGRLAVPEKLYVYVCSFWNTESFKIMEDLIRECVPNNTPPRNSYDT